VSNVKELPSPTSPIQRPKPKPVDEDLYKISPELLYAKNRKVLLVAQPPRHTHTHNTLLLFSPLNTFFVLIFITFIMSNSLHIQSFAFCIFSKSFDKIPFLILFCLLLLFNAEERVVFLSKLLDAYLHCLRSKEI